MLRFALAGVLLAVAGCETVPERPDDVIRQHYSLHHASAKETVLLLTDILAGSGTPYYDAARQCIVMPDPFEFTVDENDRGFVMRGARREFEAQDLHNLIAALDVLPDQN